MLKGTLPKSSGSLNSIYPSIHLSILSSIHPSTHLVTHPPSTTYPPMHPSIRLPPFPSTHTPIHPSSHHPSIIRPSSIHSPSIHHPSIISRAHKVSDTIFRFLTWKMSDICPLPLSNYTLFGKTDKKTISIYLR